MEYSPDFLKKLTTIGTLGYNIQKIINILDIPESDQESFVADFNDPKSDARKTSNMSTIDAQEFELKSLTIQAEKKKMQSERDVETMINQFLGYECE